MILNCPSCESRFLVDNSLIPEGGREVRCANCGHQWWVRPEADAAELPAKDAEKAINFEEGSPIDPDETEEVEAFNTDSDADAEYPEDRDVPPVDVDLDALSIGGGPTSGDLAQDTTERSIKPLIYASGMLLICALIASLFVMRSTLQPSLGFIYNLLGMPTTEGLVLADVEMRERPSRTKARYIIEGKILNQSDEVRQIPILRVSIIDKQGNVMTSREYEADDSANSLQPGEHYPFKAGRLETSFKDRVDHLIVDIGHGTELMLRSEN